MGTGVINSPYACGLIISLEVIYYFYPISQTLIYRNNCRWTVSLNEIYFYKFKMTNNLNWWTGIGWTYIRFCCHCRGIWSICTLNGRTSGNHAINTSWTCIGSRRTPILTSWTDSNIHWTDSSNYQSICILGKKGNIFDLFGNRFCPPLTWRKIPNKMVMSVTSNFIVKNFAFRFCSEWSSNYN